MEILTAHECRSVWVPWCQLLLCQIHQHLLRDADSCTGSIGYWPKLALSSDRVLIASTVTCRRRSVDCSVTDYYYIYTQLVTLTWCCDMYDAVSDMYDAVSDMYDAVCYDMVVCVVSSFSLFNVIHSCAALHHSLCWIAVCFVSIGYGHFDCGHVSLVGWLTLLDVCVTSALA